MWLSLLLVEFWISWTKRWLRWTIVKYLFWMRLTSFYRRILRGCWIMLFLSCPWKGRYCYFLPLSLSQSNNSWYVFLFFKYKSFTWGLKLIFELSVLNEKMYCFQTTYPYSFLLVLNSWFWLINTAMVVTMSFFLIQWALFKINLLLLHCIIVCETRGWLTC